MMYTLMRTFRLGVQNILLNGLRSFLTILGVVCGVASVIAMLAIGEGLSYDVQQKIQELGSNNILIRSVKPPESTAASAESSRLSMYGLTYDDVERIKKTLEAVEVLVPVRAIYKDIRYTDRRAEGRIVGTIPWYTEVNDYQLERGRFLTEVDLEMRRPVCVLGNSIARELFPLEDPIGKLVKLGTYSFRCVGVMQPRTVIRGDDTNALEDFGFDVYAPLTAVREIYGEVIVKISSGSRDMEQVELHQVQVRVEHLDYVESTAKVVKEILAYSHKDKADYEVVVPLSLLRNARETKRMFTIVLGCIAGISLLVGGIGITNVMLATVTERTREIGVRRALGAKQGHIIAQFLVETVVLACGGGLVGVAFGTGIPPLVEWLYGMTTITKPQFLALAFSTSAAVGIIFGIYPAWRASTMDPVEALRHE